MYSEINDEKKEIKSLFFRKQALNELLISISDNRVEKNNLYNKIIEDIANNNFLYQEWWNRAAEKYKWKSVEGYHWNINFETNEIFLNDDKI